MNIHFYIPLLQKNNPKNNCESYFVNSNKLAKMYAAFMFPERKREDLLVKMQSCMPENRGVSTLGLYIFVQTLQWHFGKILNKAGMWATENILECIRCFWQSFSQKAFYPLHKANFVRVQFNNVVTNPNQSCTITVLFLRLYWSGILLLRIIKIVKSLLR